MTAGEVATWVTLTLGGGGLATLIRMVHDWRKGISSDERQAHRDAAEDRRDTIADRDALLTTVLGEVRELRERVERLEVWRDRARDHIDALEAHIWRGKPPPPPARPEGV